MGSLSWPPLTASRGLWERCFPAQSIRVRVRGIARRLPVDAARVARARPIGAVVRIAAVVVDVEGNPLGPLVASAAVDVGAPQIDTWESKAAPN